MTDVYDVLIAGGGIVGLTAALAMQQRGYNIALLDGGSLRIDTNAHNTRVYAINAASRKLFQQLGIWELMDQSRFSSYSNMQVWDAKSGASIQFDARSLAASSLGFILEESVIRHALLKKIQASDHIHLFDASIIDRVQQDHATVMIHAGDKHWSGKFLMVTDGAQSAIRQLLKVPLTTWPYHQQALVATVQTELPHQKTAWQVFHPEGPLAFLPLSDPHACSIVWTTTPKDADALIAADETTFNERVTKAFACKLGKVTVKSKRNQFPLIMRHAQTYTGKNWILLGDAAHTIHPLAGLGLNLGLADIATFLSCLDTNAVLPPNASLLGRYQRKRKYETWQVIALLESLKRLFESNLQPVVLLRSLGLRACDSLGLIKRFLTTQATGMMD